ncbi:hypothetical protein [Haloechinothrix halophila]|uniref:hypothetical protein n=1 Tax=Haloechinothrix halophila TaxID=1069073 RepID=UPI000417EEDF|nr:hypothetical protein [Haloechinothrix halophila]
MKKPTNMIFAGLAVAASFVLIAPTAAAGSTTIHRDSATGDPYSGAVHGDLISAAVEFESSAGNATCDQSTLDGSVNSDGTDADIADASYSDSSASDGSCPNDQGGRTTITPTDLPWSGGNVTYAPETGGQDGTITINNVSAEVDSTNSWGMQITCHFVGAGANDSVTGSVYNPDNANRPVSSVDEAQAELSQVELTLTSGDLGCPSSATMTATYSILGETESGSGTFDQTLYITS